MDISKSMTGKTVLITGGTGGIGPATAIGLATTGLHGLPPPITTSLTTCGDARSPHPLPRCLQ